MKKIIILLPFLLLSCHKPVETINFKSACIETLTVFTDTLFDLQIKNPNSPDYGAIQCHACDVLHTRAAEAVFPFIVRFQETGDEKWLKAATRLGNWLIQQQQPDGSWKETPEEWTGTTTDQLLMLLKAWPVLKTNLNPNEITAWQQSMKNAADFLVKEMSPDFASINYCATTTATLALMNEHFPDVRYVEQARQLAFQVLSKMNDDGFICAEGDRVYGAKYGADVGYEIDMSLWGLGMYAQITGDTLTERYVTESLKKHLAFVYPNGAIDGSWGIRSNKWTTYGSETADGCQILFAMFADKDPRYIRAAFLNLQYLNGMIHNGLLGYGPQYFELFDKPPCIYPTFVRSKNLAMAASMNINDVDISNRLYSEQPGFFKFYPSVDVTLVRTKEFMATVTAYGYEELKKRNKSKYMHRPTGGSISNLWLKDHGFLQLSSQTEYHRWEPMHFPEIGDVLPLTSRIEFENENGYFTNLYEYDARMDVADNGKSVTVAGELKNNMLLQGGVAYKWQYSFSDNAIVKNVRLRYHDGTRNVKIVEPIIMIKDLNIEQIDEKTVNINGPYKTIQFKVLDGSVTLKSGIDKEKYWAAFPSVKAFPLVLDVNCPNDSFKQSVRYKFQVLN